MNKYVELYDKRPIILRCSLFFRVSFFIIMVFPIRIATNGPGVGAMVQTEVSDAFLDTVQFLFDAEKIFGYQF
ncbi:hypothetical protein [Nitrosomonas sp. Nm166]|uniref:hypothetical protein n=1 Tax=Nitrosomonas sp. Nm166 TaxID=1881054 RepID=UPI000B85483B|nr:hypothetical protein [Nitrosomonas sp. Nm166]